MELLEGSLRPDHVHMVVEIAPKYSVSEVVGFVKGKSAVKLFDLHPGIRQRLWGRHFWSRGYCASTVGLDEEEIRAYVRWQLERIGVPINSNSGKDKTLPGSPNLKPPPLGVELHVCRAWHMGRHREADMSLKPAVVGRKGNANKARAGPAMSRLKEACGRTRVRSAQRTS